MKFTLGVLVIFLAGALAQTVTEDVLAAQADLALGHEFFETAFFINRGQVSSYLYRINREIIDSHIDTYSLIKNYGINALAELNALETTPENEACLNSIINRWNLQVTRYGHRLAGCVNGAYRLIREWNSFLNDLHSTGQVSANQVQNLGVKVFAETEIFDGRNRFGPMINREFRIGLQVFLTYRDRFEAFVNEISTDVVDTIRNLIDCDVELMEEFHREVDRDLARGRACVGYIPSPETPAPTI